MALPAEATVHVVRLEAKGRAVAGRLTILRNDGATRLRLEGGTDAQVRAPNRGFRPRTAEVRNFLNVPPKWLKFGIITRLQKESMHIFARITRFSLICGLFCGDSIRA